MDASPSITSGHVSLVLEEPSMRSPMLGLLAALLCCCVRLVTGEERGPTLLSPRDGMEITDVASYFAWLPTPGVSSYDIQLAMDQDFTRVYVAKRTKDKGYHKHLYFPKDLLPAGAYWWRVRAVRDDGGEGPWSAVARVQVNAVHSVAKTLLRPISPEQPLFLMRNRAWNPLTDSTNVDATFPDGLKRVLVVDDLAMAGSGVFARAQKYQDLGLDFVVWNDRCQVSLATLEYLFQKFSHCLGTAEGEHFSGMYWERGPEGNLAERDFIERAWVLCAKYGRTYFFADGDGGTYRWPTFATNEKTYFDQYPANLVAMFKTTNADLALHSYGSVQGLMAAGRVANCGVWVDEWIWPCYGFGKLGEVIPDADIWAERRKDGTKLCPWSYDIQMWLMGIVSGATVFHLESAHQWDGSGKGAQNYQRYFLPFVKAVVDKQLIPRREAFLAATKLAVITDPTLAKGQHHSAYGPPFAFLNQMYAIKDRGSREIIPNQSRYGIVCILPPGSQRATGTGQAVPLAELQDPVTAQARFDAAYPQRFTGDSFMWECDRTVIMTNSNENQDVDQTFSMPLACTPVAKIAGIAGVHRYLIGKIAADRSGFWFQTNAEDSKRPFVLVMNCPDKPKLAVEPTTALISATWSALAHQLTLQLSNEPGAVNVEIR
jgi:hypothetical protein